MVLYLLCYDLSKPPSEQQAQLQYWLSYLNSLLCAGRHVPETHAYSDWRVMLVGTKADMKQQDSLSDPAYWEEMFPLFYAFIFIFILFSPSRHTHAGTFPPY